MAKPHGQSNASRPPALVLGDRLREIREDAGYPISGVPGISESKLRRIEQGTSPVVRAKDVWDLLRTYRFTDDGESRVLISLADQTEHGDWIDRLLNQQTQQYLFLRREGDACRLRSHNASWVPALVQPRQYIERIHQLVPWDRLGEDRDTALQARVQWQRDFEQRVAEGRTRGQFVVGEEALLRARAMGVGDVVEEALVAADAVAGIEVLIVPLGAGAYHGLGFEYTILDFPGGGGDQMVWMAAVTSSRSVTNRKDVLAVNTMFGDVAGMAMSVTDFLGGCSNG